MTQNQVHPSKLIFSDEYRQQMADELAQLPKSAKEQDQFQRMVLEPARVAFRQLWLDRRPNSLATPPETPPPAENGELVIDDSMLVDGN